MKQRFDFSLERVRQVRAHDEDRAKEALASSLATRDRGEENLAVATERLRAAQSLTAEAAPIDAATLQRRQAFLERLERSRLVAALDLDRASQEVDARREVLTGASRRRQVLDRLRDRQAAAHAQAYARHEASVLDEIALQGHVRRSAA